jgi:serine/threonine protein kinase
VKILDFGLARPSGLASAEASGAPTIHRQTDPGTVLGTVGYLSPEQARAEAGAPRADLFSLGALLYELLSGRRAFQYDTAPETLTAILREDPRTASVCIRHLAAVDWRGSGLPGSIQQWPQRSADTTIS